MANPTHPGDVDPEQEKFIRGLMAALNNTKIQGLFAGVYDSHLEPVRNKVSSMENHITTLTTNYNQLLAE